MSVYRVTLWKFPSFDTTETDKYESGIEVRHSSVGMTGEKKLAVSSIAPAAKVKFEYEESYEVESGMAEMKVSSCGRLRLPTPSHS